MLRGIDISNNNKGLKLTDTSLLYIMKATEGTSFVDRYCDPWVQWCIANGVPWGFYHFMRPNGGVAEAEFFYRNTRNYFTHGVPILDFEDDRLTDADAESFVWRIHELSGVWPLVYTYSDFINGQGHLKNSWVKDKCGLWLAGYPSRRTGWPSDATCPYVHAPYATQDHVSTIYATKASLKVTDDSIKAEVSARAQTDQNVADLCAYVAQLEARVKKLEGSDA